MLWENFLEQNHLAGVPYYSECVEKNNADNATEHDGEFFVSIHQKLYAANENERFDILLDHIKEKTTKVLGLSLQKDDESFLRDDEPLVNYGLDSLTAIELRNNLQSSLLINGLPTTLGFDTRN